jgi:hypothetical protein
MGGIHSNTIMNYPEDILVVKNKVGPTMSRVYTVDNDEEMHDLERFCDLKQLKVIGPVPIRLNATSVTDFTTIATQLRMQLAP